MPYLQASLQVQCYVFATMNVFFGCMDYSYNTRCMRHKHVIDLTIFHVLAVLQILIAIDFS